jgi:hypothetical protein
VISAHIFLRSFGYRLFKKFRLFAEPQEHELALPDIAAKLVSSVGMEHLAAACHRHHLYWARVKLHALLAL